MTLDKAAKNFESIPSIPAVAQGVNDTILHSCFDLCSRFKNIEINAIIDDFPHPHGPSSPYTILESTE